MYADNEMNTVEKVLASTDLFALIEHCKDGAIENNRINDVTFAYWESGRDIAEFYLDFGGDRVEYLEENPEEMELLVKSLDDWLAKVK